MQTVRILQAVTLMLIVALAASCAATKEYTGKLFAPKTASAKDSQAVALRFLETGESDMNTADWVSTDIIMGRDTSNSTALDDFAKTYPATATVKPKKDSITVVAKEVKDPVVKTSPNTGEPVAKTTAANGVRSKKTREE